MNAMARNHNEDMARWLKEIEEGSAEAFDLLYERVVPWLLPIACQLLGDRMEAEDAIHDVLLAVIRHPERYDRSRGTVEAWLAVQLRSRCLDRLRKRSRIVLQEAAEADAAERQAPARTEEAALARLEMEAVRRALRELPGLHRRTLAEAYYTSRSQRELAEDWRVPLGTVKSRIRYGLNHLRKSLEKMGWAEAEGGDGHG